jgi:Uncharacterised protein family UPF0547
MVTTYLLIWSLGGAILCDFLAAAKGRGGAGGFVIGALFGIFALIYYAFVPSKAATAAGADRKPCPQCAEYIGIAAQVCPHCGYKFAAQTLQRPQGVPVWPGIGKQANAWCPHLWPRSDAQPRGCLHEVREQQ